MPPRAKPKADAVAEVTSVYVLADTPEHDFTQNPGQLSSTMKGYLYDAEPGEDVTAVMQRVLPTAGFGVGTKFYGWDASTAVEMQVSANVGPVA